jgi:hypothetical protein
VRVETREEAILSEGADEKIEISRTIFARKDVVVIK